MLTKEQFVDRIVSFIRSNFPFDASMEVPLDQSLIEAGILDSYAMLEMVTFFEVEFDIIVEDEEINKENLGSVMKMADFLVMKQELR